jgi:uncharacterized repeat protein (TIGR03803 family)
MSSPKTAKAVPLTAERAPAWLLMLIMAAALYSPVAAHSQTLTTLYDLQGSPTDGDWPCAGVIRDAKGNMYGTTQGGGQWGYGTVFALGANNTEAVLHNFEDSDGQSPCAPLIYADGALYGTTTYGGENENGTVFSIRGTHLTVLYKFQGIPDGQGPFGGLVDNIDGAFYGTTGQGGSGTCAGACGTIYKIDKAGHETVLYSFSGRDGAYPAARLIHDPAGNLYGTTNGGGANNLCPSAGCGTVFKFDTSGTLTVLHSFTGGTADGWFVVTSVVRDAAGNLYGTTSGGGTWNLGTIFEITNKGKERVLYSFAGPPDGWNPNQLVLAHGKLYGTTYLGGQSDCWGLYGGGGTIFEFDQSGTEKVLYRFGGVTDGAQPTGPVAFDSSGNMYGTTQSGIKDGCPFSHGGCGTVWKLALGTADTP